METFGETISAEACFEDSGFTEEDEEEDDDEMMTRKS